MCLDSQKSTKELIVNDFYLSEKPRLTETQTNTIAQRGTTGQSVAGSIMRHAEKEMNCNHYQF